MKYNTNGKRIFGLRRKLLVGSTILCSGMTAPAFAQSLPPAPETTDKNGVNLTDGLYRADFPTISIGLGDSAISARRSLIATTVRGGQINLYRPVSGSNITTVDVEGAQYKFTTNGSSFVSKGKNGTTLVMSGKNYIFTDREGAVYTFVPYYDYYIQIASAHYPNGKILSFNGSTTTSNYGYQRNYQGDPYRGGQTVKLVNLAVDFCDSNGSCPHTTQTWPFLTYVQDFTTSGQSDGIIDYSSEDALGRITAVHEFEKNVQTQGLVTSVTVSRPGIANPEKITNYTQGGRVEFADVRGSSTEYAWSQYSTELDVQTSGYIPFPVKSVRSDGQYSYDGRKQYEYDDYGRLTKVIFANGSETAGYSLFEYDDRGNVIKETTKARSGSTLPDAVKTAYFSPTCSNRLTCNKPIWVRDARGNQTNYTYIPDTGQIATETLPANGAGIRAITTFSYSKLQAYYKNSSGQIVASGQPISMLTSISQCLTSATCAGTADELKTIFDYGPQQAGVANNLLVRSVTKQSGDGKISSSATYSYDPFGHVVSIDGPISGTSDTTYYRYDAVGRRVGQIDPDPDGSGPRLRRAVRTTYNDADQPTLVEIGTVTSNSEAAWQAFKVSEQIYSGYDANGYKTFDRVKAGGVVQQVVQYSFDGFGHLKCKAIRMNKSAWSALPASACTPQATGTTGPDRIAQTDYTAWGGLLKLQTGLGTSDIATEAQYTYNDNNLKPATVTDANNNKTTYGYDGFDRLATATYPDGSYDKVGYDPNGNVTSRRRRDGSSISYTYDALDRMTFENRVNHGIDEDVTNTYDLLGHLTYTSTPSGHKTGFGYDALGRPVSETTTYGGTKISTYDSAGRRRRLTWPDGFYVTYDYDALGKMTAVREKGAASGVGVLATYAYDDLGNRKSITRGNGVTTTYGYDPASRLTSLIHNLAGTADDETVTFTYNPAGQIASRTSSNDIYAWNGAVNVNRSYTTNALNQYTASGGVSLGYDSNGNLTSSGASTYAYGQHNQLYSVPGSTLHYDPLDRLDVILDNTTKPTFDYDGADLVTERTYGSSAITRRYVFGAGVDEPLVWYEGAGTADRRWLIADERGSVIAVTNASGTATAINTYDEYGIPGSGNQGRFQYTGQIWLPQVGLYYYKSRMYSPSLGRFMQTDPIGYADGLNWYNYVGSDPINLTDPAGTNFTCNDGRYLDQAAYDQANKSATPCLTTPDIVVDATVITIFLNLTNGGSVRHYQDAVKEIAISPQRQQVQMCPAAYTPYGDTKGDNPRPQGDRYNTDLPGGYAAALATFQGLTRLEAAENGSAGGYHLEIDPRRPTTVFRSNSGHIGLRYAFQNGSLVFRVDIDPNTFSLTKAETIHFNGSGRGNMCPTP